MNINHTKIGLHANLHNFHHLDNDWKFCAFTKTTCDNGELNINLLYYCDSNSDDDMWFLPREWYVNGVCNVPKCINLDNELYPTSRMDDEAIYFLSHYLPKLQKLQVFG